MVVRNGSEANLVESSRLRRSRRLSSTRGLQPRRRPDRTSADEPRQDLNQKLGLCPIVSKNVEDAGETKKRFLINWDLNERISLSSGSSTGLEIRPDMRRGPENRNLNDYKLDRMNVSGFPEEGAQKRKGSWSIAIDVIKGPNDNVIRSDSKYEESSKVKGKMDKSDDSIGRRLELIHELNQKIMSKCERFRMRSNVKADGKLGKTKVKGSKVEEDHVYSEVKRRNKSVPSIELPESNKFTFSKDYCDRLVFSKENDGLSVHEKDADHENFILSKGHKVKGSTMEEDQSYTEIKHRNKVVLQPSIDLPESNKFTFSKDYCDRLVLSKDTGGLPVRKKDTVCENFSFSKEECNFRNSKLSNKVFKTDKSSKELQRNPQLPVNDKSYLENSKLYPERNSVHSRHDSNMDHDQEEADQKALEKEILDSLNRTIDKFDLDDVTDGERKNSDSCNGSESFSTDSIQTSSPLQDSTNAKKSLVETFNCSWDSGVGVELGTGSGWIRIHTGIESSLVYLTLDTTAKDVCRDMLLGDDLSLFVQYGGEPGRRLCPREKPLELQDYFLQLLGYQDVSRRARLGVDPELRHLIAFHVGPASPSPELDGYSRCGYAFVLKGLVFPQWKRRPLAVIGSRLFLFSDCQAEWIELGYGGGGAVCYAPSRLGKLVLRVTGYPKVTQQRRKLSRRQTRHLYLGFHHPWDRDLWKSWIKRVISLKLSI
ncbi:uncharacterized protein [Prorops nasuta]|uniref:uncharacterized protein n=1 Tax=Prorops nasuta TaxID=863751 RepID=UPI0034CF7C6A